jgi:large subunit ribosomal protein L24e
MMVERRVCSFCGNEIEPGTGKMYVKIDGTIYNFCKNKCHKNLIDLKRVPRRTKWTQPYMREKSSKTSTNEFWRNEFAADLRHVKAWFNSKRTYW